MATRVSAELTGSRRAAYWMEVATRMSSSGVMRWSWPSSPIRSSTQLTLPVNRLASPV